MKNMNPLVLGLLFGGMVLLGLAMVQSVVPDPGKPIDRHVPGATTGPGKSSFTP